MINLRSTFSQVAQDIEDTLELKTEHLGYWPDINRHRALINGHIQMLGIRIGWRSNSEHRLSKYER